MSFQGGSRIRSENGRGPLLLEEGLQKKWKGGAPKAAHQVGKRTRTVGNVAKGKKRGVLRGIQPGEGECSKKKKVSGDTGKKKG